jgi:5-methylcytosine-specific restriction protein A
MTEPAYKRWYKTARWQKLRLLQLYREPLCRMCRPRLTPATVADHEAPHRGDAVLFWDPDNLQSLCKRCHDGDKQRIEKGGKPKPRISLSGWPEE